MSSFQLAGLEPQLLEKIFNKHEMKGHFRLQQTCRWVKDFIPTIPTLSIHLDGDYTIEFAFKLPIPDDKVPNRLYFVLSKPGSQPDVSLEGLYRARLNSLSVRTGCHFEELFDFLRSNHITCKNLYMRYGNIDEPWTKEKSAILLDILKPQSIRFLARLDSNGYEALHNCPQLESVRVDIDLDGWETVARRLFAVFPDVTIYICESWAKKVKRLKNPHLFFEDLDENHPFESFRTILKIVQEFPNVKKFHLIIATQLHMRYAQLEQDLAEFGLVVGYNQSTDCLRSGLIKLPNGYRCKIILDESLVPWKMELYYGEAHEDDCTYFVL